MSQRLSVWTTVCVNMTTQVDQVGCGCTMSLLLNWVSKFPSLTSSSPFYSGSRPLLLSFILIVGPWYEASRWSASISEYLLPPMPFSSFLLSLVHPAVASSQVGYHSERTQIRRCSFFMKSPSINLNPYTLKPSGLQARFHFGRRWKASKHLIAIGASILTHLGLMRVPSSPRNKPSFNFFFKVLGRIIWIWRT